jgi:hypothetical protein
MTLISDSVNIDTYANDSTLYKSDTDILVIEKELQKSLNLVNKWCKNNDMSLQKCMLLGSTFKTKWARNLENVSS